MITSMACDDTLAATATLRLLAHYGSSAGMRALVNFFDFDAREGAQCPSMSSIQRNGTSTRLYAYIAALTCVPGFKTKLWLTISSNLTSSYEFVWLRDSDVVTSPRLFLPSDVEHWMWRTDATVASPSVLSLHTREDRRSRSSFPRSCMVQTTPIVEQTTPIFRRAAFDGFHRHLASMPARFLQTGIGLETFWCGFRWSDVGTSTAATAVGGTAPALPSCSEVDRRLAGRWTCGERVAWLMKHGLDAAAARSRLYKEFPTICSGCTHLRQRRPAASAAVGSRDGSRDEVQSACKQRAVSMQSAREEARDEVGRCSRCVLLHHVSVVLADGRSTARNLQANSVVLANWTRFTRPLKPTLTVKPNATDDLRGYLMQHWQSAMSQHGHAPDHHHRSHRRRCWGDPAASGEEIDDDTTAEAALKARRRTTFNAPPGSLRDMKRNGSKRTLVAERKKRRARDVHGAAMTASCRKAFFCTLRPGSAAQAAAVQVMPVSYAFSTHKNVVDKMRSYGHVWTTIATFYHCVVLPLLQQQRHGSPLSPTRAPSDVSTPALPISKHVVLPLRLAQEEVTGHRGRRAFEELSTIFSGPGTGLQVHRAEWVPVCYEAKGRGCCATNASDAVPPASTIESTLLHKDHNDHKDHKEVSKAGGSSDALAGLLAHSLPIRLAGRPSDLGSLDAAYVPAVRLVQLNVNEPGNTLLLRGVDEARDVRRLAWANVDATSVSPATPSAAREALCSRPTPVQRAGPSAHLCSKLVLWASSERPQNGRTIANEALVVERVRAHLARAWPAHSFLHQELQRLSYADEVRLMRRASVFISLFGSALHNCRWMRPGAIVIEIRGAMKNDYPDYMYYAGLCAVTMGLRWAGLATKGHAPAWTRDANTGKVEWGGHARRDDFHVAKVDAAELIGTLDHALRGNLTHLVRQYAANITWPPVDKVRSWADGLLAEPQYNGSFDDLIDDG